MTYTLSPIGKDHAVARSDALSLPNCIYFKPKQLMMRGTRVD